MSDLYLGFTIDGRRFCSNLSGVCEVRQISGVSHIPHTAAHVIGVVNLRGEVIPVVDLPLLLGAPARKREGDPGICLIAEINDRMTALVVDSVSDVVQRPAESILRIPAESIGVDGRFYDGLFEDNNEHILIVNLVAVVGALRGHYVADEEPV